MEPKEEHRLQTKQSPIFTKTYDLLKWLVPHVDKYPKSQRFRLAKRIEDAAFEFYGLLIQATKEGKPRRTLLRADAELDKLRHYIRLGVDLRHTSPRQYAHVAAMLVEVGKLLGGWSNWRRPCTRLGATPGKYRIAPPPGVGVAETWGGASAVRRSEDIGPIQFSWEGVELPTSAVQLPQNGLSEPYGG